MSLEPQAGARPLPAALRAKPILGSDGAAQCDADGRIQYMPVLEWASRDAFSVAAVEAVSREYPAAFEETPP
jgi:hypothetical protein